MDSIKKMIMNDGAARMYDYESNGKKLVANYDKDVVATEVEEELQETYGRGK